MTSDVAVRAMMFKKSTKTNLVKNENTCFYFNADTGRLYKRAYISIV